jgi:hypothetical protein
LETVGCAAITIAAPQTDRTYGADWDQRLTR